MSTRILGGIIMAHGDDQGLVLPPRLAPHQVVVVPIGNEVLPAARRLVEQLAGSGIRVHLDDRPQHSAGFKFNEWELRGVPLRVELGRRELDAGVATVSGRLNRDKEQVALPDLATALPTMLDEFGRQLLRRATEFRDARLASVETWEEFADAVAAGWALARHCGRVACEERIQAATGATPRCLPDCAAPAGDGTCIACDTPSGYGTRVLFARAY